MIATSLILLCFHFGVHSGDHYLHFGVTWVIILWLASFIHPSLICKDGSHLGEVRLKVLGERSGKGARVSAGFRVVWEGCLARGGSEGCLRKAGNCYHSFIMLLSLFYRFWWSGKEVWLGVASEGCLRRDGNAPILDCYHFLSFCLLCFNRVVSFVYHAFIISRIAQDFGDHFSLSFLQNGQDSGNHFLSFPDGSRIWGSFLYHCQNGRGLRHRAHTGGKDIWPDLLHHKQHNIYGRSIEGFPKSKSPSRMQKKRVRQIQVTDREIQIICLHLSTCGTKNLITLV